MMFDFNLDEVLEQPTVARTEAEQPKVEEALDDFSGLEFDELPDKGEINLEDELPEGVSLSPYDPEENAEMLVELIDSMNIAILTPLARWKLVKKRGGKSEIRKMQVIAAKKFNAQKLSDAENRLLNQYQAYLKDKEELEHAIPYTEEEKEKLKKSATVYMKKVQMKIGGGATFWVELAVIQGSRIVEVLTA